MKELQIGIPDGMQAVGSPEWEIRGIKTIDRDREDDIFVNADI